MGSGRKQPQDRRSEDPNKQDAAKQIKSKERRRFGPHFVKGPQSPKRSAWRGEWRLPEALDPERNCLSLGVTAFVAMGSGRKQPQDRRSEDPNKQDAAKQIKSKERRRFGPHFVKGPQSPKRSAWRGEWRLPEALDPERNCLSLGVAAFVCRGAGALIISHKSVGARQQRE